MYVHESTWAVHIVLSWCPIKIELALQEEVEHSLDAIRQLGGEYVRTVKVASFSSEGQRTAVVVRKICATPAKFPRATGVPKKRPL
jgi:16S rRNA (guanine527-N7)-methyltransferase